MIPVTTIGLIQGLYIVAGVMFILSLAGLSKPATARAGNTIGIVQLGRR